MYNIQNVGAVYEKEKRERVKKAICFSMLAVMQPSPKI